MSKLGLHLRLTTNILELIQKALRLQLPFFQCFLLFQHTNKYVDLEAPDIHEYLLLRRDNFKQLFAHASYWINGANKTCDEHPLLKKELALAQQLEFTHLVLHPGSANGCSSKEAGIDNLARLLNNLLKKESDVQLVLENTAHGNLSIGSDLTDFRVLLEKLDKPEKIAFCIDTAHAYAFSYDLASKEGLEQFILLVEKYIGLSRLALIHLNDTREKCGSKIDRHALPIEGRIGRAQLQKIIQHPLLSHIPMLMELPLISEDQEIVILHEFESLN